MALHQHCKARTILRHKACGCDGSPSGSARSQSEAPPMSDWVNSERFLPGSAACNPRTVAADRCDPPARYPGQSPVPTVRPHSGSGQLRGWRGCGSGSSCAGLRRPRRVHRPIQREAARRALRPASRARGSSRSGPPRRRLRRASGKRHLAQRLQAFIAIRKVGQRAEYPGTVEQAHDLYRQAAQPVRFIKQRRDNQQPVGGAAREGGRMFGENSEARNRQGQLAIKPGPARVQARACFICAKASSEP